MKLHQVNRQIVEAYKKCGIPASQRLKRLNLSDVCAGGDEYPVLKHCKGRRIRHFSKVAIVTTLPSCGDKRGWKL
jgi:hypothetical protein